MWTSSDRVHRNQSGYNITTDFIITIDRLKSPVTRAKTWPGVDCNRSETAGMHVPSQIKLKQKNKGNEFP